MAMYEVGSVTVAADGAVTKSGEAEILYDLFEADMESAAAAAGASLRSGSQGVASRRAIARMANSIARYVHSAITERAQALVEKGTPSTGLQRVPSPNVSGIQCAGPVDDKYLRLV